MEAFTFQCSICGDTSTKLCVYCTKDACKNHLCDRCHRCSDCCLCEVPTSEPEPPPHAVKVEEVSPKLDVGSENLDPSDLYLQNGSYAQETAP
jgi:hypothetical protein